MHRVVIRPVPLALASACLAVTAFVLSACGGGGGGSSSGGGGSTPSIPSGPETGTLASIDDTFQLKIKNAGAGQMLTIAGQSQTAGAAIAVAADNGAPEQLWHVMPMGGNRFNIENMLTHQVAGISSASTSAGAGAVQWADNSTNDHLWSFYQLSNGNYLILNINSNLYLTADGSGNVTQAARASSGTAQEWTVTATTTAAYPAPITLTGTGVFVHDPNMIQDGSGKFWFYGTHNTLAGSTDMSAFASVSAGDINPDFSWWASKNTTGGSGRTDIWAPSVMFANGKYYQYYSIPIYDIPSVAGSNQGAEAVIALATSTNPNGPWTDVGQIIASCGKTAGCTTKFNAIDPAPFIDAAGNWWMAFGSWEDGIHVLPLDPTTGLRQGTALYDISARSNGVEGAFIYPAVVNGTQYYYYFASINGCCAGTTSTYRIVVGRATSPTGPYLDRGGLDLKNGGGTILLSSHGNIFGPGGQSVLKVGTTPVLVYHYYDGNANGVPKLGINNLSFDAAGWPRVN